MSEADVLEIGAGEQPRPESTETLDIREDLDHIDHGGVDVGRDRWPVESESVDRVLAFDLVEHVPGDRLGHLWEEIDRVLRPGGELIARMPHAGTWEAWTDPTHAGTGGSTASLAGKFEPGPHGYWAHLGWEVTSRAELSFPSILRPEWRATVETENGGLSAELVKIPFVTGLVWIEATKPAGGRP